MPDISINRFAQALPSVLQRILAVALAVTVAGALLAGAGIAQTVEPGASMVETLKPALEKVEKDGATVIIVGPGTGNEADVATPPEPGLRNTLALIAVRLQTILGNAAQAMENMSRTLAAASPQGQLWWILQAILAAAAGLAIGHVVQKPVSRWVRDVFAPYIPDVPTSRSQKIGYLLFRGTIFFLIASIGGIVGTIVVLVYAGGHTPSAVTGLAVVWCYTAIRLAEAVYINFLVPNVPEYRVIHMSDADAAGIFTSLRYVTATSGIIIAVCIWMFQLGLDDDTHKLFLIAGSLIAAIMFSAIAVIYRRPVAGAILGPGAAASKPVWQRLLSRAWHVLLVLYIVAAWLVSSGRLVLDLPPTSGIVAAPLLALIAGLILYGVALLVIDRVFTHRERAARASATLTGDETAPSPVPDATAADTPADGTPPEPAARPQTVSVVKQIAEHAAALLILFTGIAAIAHRWGVDFANPDHPVRRSLGILLVVFVAYIAYRGVEAWIDEKTREEEGEPSPEPEVGGDPGGAGATRLATLLPIFRNFLLITIVVITGMIVLSEMGVDIGPLFAGAGVVGLAIGFGAQALIRDIFSGAFFLLDDAFRKGEYIDIGSAKGTVEKISIRSMQLRHHNGPLNTVPFGEITQLTNYSRDWVMMKLPLRLTYDTDVEKVRKLVKKLGIELLEHPEVGHKFLQPLKSQGVKQMDDSAMIVRLKYMTKPGDQFDVRKIVYQRIREIFAENGIKFAHREVTVRIADETGGELTDEQKRAVSGSVRSVIEDAAKPSTADTP